MTNKIEKKEDCRDYLRTGRCKYGASCKYNHPLNVQSGGGMKAPINPSEPLFPIRYNEPVCQYYMKHGTCKFGQACKFHHPPHIAGTSNVMNGSNSVLASVPGGGRKEDGGSHSGMMWKGGNDSGLQILPQRPDEPNCIYFLKNGRCKYGATCRYHHPLKYHHDNNRSRNNAFEDGRNSSKNTNRQTQDIRSAPKVHYVTALPPGSIQQGHFVVADGTVTFLSLDGNAPAHVVSISQPAGAGGKDYATVGTVASSTSSTSIASSFETSITNLEPNELSSGSLWNNRKASGNVSSAYSLPRVVSTGSAQSDCNSSLFYDSNTGPSSWRGPRSSSFDHTRTRSTSHSNQDEMIRSASAHSGLDERPGGRSRSASMTSPMAVAGNSNLRDTTIGNVVRDQRLPGEVDDGLSMMTSALLTMLDTPTEDVGALKQSDKYDIDDRIFGSSSRSDNQYFAKPVANNRAPLYEDSSREYHDDPSTCYGQPQLVGQNNSNTIDQSSDLSTTLPTTVRSNLNVLDGQPKDQSILNQISRIQSWQGSAAAGVIHENAQFSAINPTQQLPSSSPNTSTNVGLYY